MRRGGDEAIVVVDGEGLDLDAIGAAGRFILGLDAAGAVVVHFDNEAV
jgi:hypothetical protein